MTDGQKRALVELLPRYLYPMDGRAPAEIFGSEAPVTLEIGFGNGDNLFELARQHPDQHFIGLEVHRPGVGSLLLNAEQQELDNLRVSSEDALHFLAALPEDCLDRVLIFFPDPWPKKRHHKRRIVRDQALDLLARCVKPGGELLLATDWDNYAEHMMDVLSARKDWKNLYGTGGFAPRADRVMTRFERRAHRLGHRIHDLAFVKL